MSKQIEISMESIQEFFSQLPEKMSQLYEQVINYFQGLNLYQMIAWGVIGLGLILVIVSLIIW